MFNTCLSLFVAFSMHIGLSGDYNQVHPHARCDMDTFMFGTYYNSEHRVSTYVGKTFGPIDQNWTLEYGLVTGYKSYDVVPLLRYTNNGWFVAPAYEIGNNYGVVIGWEYKF